MPEFIPFRQSQSAADAPWPTLRLELRLGDGPASEYTLRQEATVIGTVAGCDVRLPGGELPPLLCLLTHHAQSLHFRSLAPACPLLLNDALAAQAQLRSGDTLTIGKFRLRVHLLHGRLSTPAKPRQDEPVNSEPASELTQARQQFEEERRDWEEDAQKQAETLAVRSRQIQERERELGVLQTTLEQQRIQIQAEQGACVARLQQARELETQLASDHQQLAAARQELAAVRDRLYEQYRKRRDGLVAMQEAVQRAARNVQEQRRQFQQEKKGFAAEQLTLTEAQKQFEETKSKVAQEQKIVSDQYELVEEWQKELETEHQQREQFVHQEEARLQQLEDALRKREEQHKQDLARLERFHAALQTRKQELDGKQDYLQRTTDELTLQTEFCKGWQSRLQAQETRIASESEAVQTAQQACEALLAQIAAMQQHAEQRWAHCERLQADLADRELQYAQARLRLDKAEVKLHDALHGLQEEEARLRQERESWEEERRQREARMAEMAAAVERFRLLEKSLAAAEADWHLQRLDADAQSVELAQTAFLLRARGERVQQMRRKLLRQRRGLEAQAGHLLQSEQTREALQEQLRRRSELLAERERELAAQLQNQQAQEEALRGKVQSWEEQRRQWEAKTAAELSALEARQRDWLAEQARFADAQAEAAAQQEQFLLARQAWEQEKTRQDEQEQERARRWEAVAAQSHTLQQSLPGALQQAKSALGQIAITRQHLREQLHEVHAYVQKSQASFVQVQQEIARCQEELRRQQQALTRQQDEHRLDVSAFRQSLADWQTQLAALRQSWEDQTTAIARREADLTDERQRLQLSASQIELRLEQLVGQERDVAQRRDLLNRQLHDMQGWYRRKMRELAERKLLQPAAETEEEEQLPAVLSIYASLPERDRLVVDLLTRMELVDPGTLTALLDEARRRQCSLRDALVEGEYLTAYQMELIESERLEALVLGHLRIIDRLRQNPWETIYRVFDPRRSSEALLRQLANSATPEQREEYRQRFTRACTVRHPHLAATYEVLEMEGAPAVVQEWVDGLPSSEWADLAATPAVWLRLFSQAAQAVKAIHDAGLSHGRLHSGRLLITAPGVLKICGLGEPGWLQAEPGATPPPETDDLAALGKLGEAWLAAGGKQRLHRPELKPLVAVVQGLLRTHRNPPYETAASLVECLAALQTQHGEDAVAWQRLLAIVAARLQPQETIELPLRRSA